MYMNKNITSLLNLVSPYILLYPVLSCFHTITAILNLYKFRASFNILSVFSRIFQNLLEFFKILTLFLSQCQSWRNEPSKQVFPSLVTQCGTFFYTPHFVVHLYNKYPSLCGTNSSLCGTNVPQMSHLWYIF